MERDGNDACNSRSASGRAFAGESPRFFKARNSSVRSYVAISMLEDCCSEASLILTVFIIATASGGLTAFYAESKLHRATRVFGYTHKDAYKISSAFFIVTSLLVCTLLLLCVRNSAKSRERFSNLSTSTHTTVSA